MDHFNSINEDDDLAPINNLISRFAPPINDPAPRAHSANGNEPNAKTAQAPRSKNTDLNPTIIKSEPFEEDQPIQVGEGRDAPLGLVELDSKKAFQGAVFQKRWGPNREMHTLESVIVAVQGKLGTHLSPLVEQYKGLKVWVGLLNTYEPIEDDKEKKIPIVTKTRLITNEPDIEKYAIEFREVIISRNSSILQGDSLLVFMKTDNVTIKVAKANLLAGRGWVRFPEYINHKKCMINI